ncbi:MAG TPA: hypothetical protein VK285_05370, partial [Gaiellaceae bacterium]|nr:hypothetical protein [Gaiellaceae bacterium]
MRCLECHGPLASAGPEAFHCPGCGTEYPVVAGSPVMLHTGGNKGSEVEDELRRRTAESFAYEWEHFG